MERIAIIAALGTKTRAVEKTMLFSGISRTICGDLRSSRWYPGHYGTKPGNHSQRNLDPPGAHQYRRDTTGRLQGRVEPPWWIPCLTPSSLHRMRREQKRRLLLVAERSTRLPCPMRLACISHSSTTHPPPMCFFPFIRKKILKLFQKKNAGRTSHCFQVLERK